MITKDSLISLLNNLSFHLYGTTYSKKFGSATLEVNIAKEEIITQKKRGW